MTNNECYKLIGILFTSYPNASLSREHADAYVSGLVDLPHNAATQAVDRLRRTSKFLPAVSEIREAATDLTVGARRTGIEAWETLGRATRRWGWQRRPKVTDPNMAFAISALGGWMAVCSLQTNDEVSARARFIEAYDIASKRERLDLDSGIPLPRAQRVQELKP